MSRNVSRHRAGTRDALAGHVWNEIAQWIATRGGTDADRIRSDL